MTFEELTEQAKADVKIDKANLDESARQNPTLYIKYLGIYHREQQQVRILKLAYDKLYRDLWEYYQGRSSNDELLKRRGGPFGHRILRPDVEIYLNADEELQVAANKLAAKTETVEYLKKVLTAIEGRNWSISHTKDILKFNVGLS